MAMVRPASGAQLSYAGLLVIVNAAPSPMAHWLDYSAKFHGMRASTSLCMCWSRILRSLAAI